MVGSRQALISQSYRNHRNDVVVLSPPSIYCAPTPLMTCAKWWPFIMCLDVSSIDQQASHVLVCLLSDEIGFFSRIGRPALMTHLMWMPLWVPNKNIYPDCHCLKLECGAGPGNPRLNTLAPESRWVNMSHHITLMATKLETFSQIKTFLCGCHIRLLLQHCKSWKATACKIWTRI